VLLRSGKREFWYSGSIQQYCKISCKSMRFPTMAIFNMKLIFNVLSIVAYHWQYLKDMKLILSVLSIVVYHRAASCPVSSTPCFFLPAQWPFLLRLLSFFKKSFKISITASFHAKTWLQIVTYLSLLKYMYFFSKVMAEVAVTQNWIHV
jgi:hypothetical protein